MSASLLVASRPPASAPAPAHFWAEVQHSSKPSDGDYMARAEVQGERDTRRGMPASSKGAATAPAVLHVIVSLCSGLLRQGCAELAPFSTCLQDAAVLQ